MLYLHCYPFFYSLNFYFTMSLRFKIAKRVQPVGKRKGKQVYYGIQEEHTKTSWATIENRIVRGTGISRPDLRAVIIALTDIIEEELLEGRSVDLADLGSIKVVAAGKMMDSFEEVDASTIGRPRIKFTARNRLRDVPSKLSMQVVKEVHQPKPKKGATTGEDTSDKPSVEPGGSEHAGI